jgi:hypothetical protein
MNDISDYDAREHRGNADDGNQRLRATCGCARGASRLVPLARIKIGHGVADVAQPSFGIFFEAAAQQMTDRGRPPHLPTAVRVRGCGDGVVTVRGEKVDPVSISNNTHPNDQTSVRLSTVLPRACSGLM